MATLTDFNANEVEPNASFDPLPASQYLAVITGSEMKPTKKGKGKYLELTFQVIEGEYKGRLVWARLNLENANATTVKIARGELSAICRAVGVMVPKDTVELHNLPLTIKVVCKKREDTGELTNEIKGFTARAGGASNSRPPRPPVNAATAAGGPAPWKRT